MSDLSLKGCRRDAATTGKKITKYTASIIRDMQKLGYTYDDAFRLLSLIEKTITKMQRIEMAGRPIADGVDNELNLNSLDFAPTAT